MDFKKVAVLFLLIVSTSCLLAQSSSNFELLGKVTIGGKNAKGVSIKAFDGNICFSNYETRSNGKFAFYGEAKKYFILQFEKPGYATKQLLVKTGDGNYSNDLLDGYKFEINLVKTKKGDLDGQYISKIDIIELDKSGKRFTYKSNRDREDYLMKDNQSASIK